VCGDAVGFVLGEVAIGADRRKSRPAHAIHLTGEQLRRLPLPFRHQFGLLGLQEIRTPPHEFERALGTARPEARSSSGVMVLGPVDARSQKVSKKSWRSFSSFSQPWAKCAMRLTSSKSRRCEVWLMKRCSRTRNSTKRTSAGLSPKRAAIRSESTAPFSSCGDPSGLPTSWQEHGYEQSQPPGNRGKLGRHLRVVGRYLARAMAFKVATA